MSSAPADEGYTVEVRIKQKKLKGGGTDSATAASPSVPEGMSSKMRLIDSSGPGNVEAKVVSDPNPQAVIYSQWRSISRQLTQLLNHRKKWEVQGIEGREYRQWSSEKGFTPHLRVAHRWKEGYNPDGLFNPALPEDARPTTRDEEKLIECYEYKRAKFDGFEPSRKDKEHVMNIMMSRDDIKVKVEKETMESRRAQLRAATEAYGLTGTRKDLRRNEGSAVTSQHRSESDDGANRPVALVVPLEQKHQVAPHKPRKPGLVRRAFSLRHQKQHPRCRRLQFQRLNQASRIARGRISRPTRTWSHRVTVLKRPRMFPFAHRRLRRRLEHRRALRGPQVHRVRQRLQLLEQGRLKLHKMARMRRALQCSWYPHSLRYHLLRQRHPWCHPATLPRRP